MPHGIRAGLLSCALLASGCSSSPTERVDECRDLTSTPAKVLTEPGLREVPEKEANLLVDLHSVSESAVRARLRIGDTLALDLELPASRGCSHPPVYSYSYRLPPGATEITAMTSQGQQKAMSLTMSGKKQWVVFMVQDGFPLHLEASRIEPAWG